MSDVCIKTSQRNGVLTVTLNRPAQSNAMTLAMHHELDQIFTRFASDEQLIAAVITGAGDNAFCAGSDLKARAPLQRDDMPATGYAGLTERFDLHKPVIAAINGHAIGGGMEIVLACDLAVAVSSAKFGLPEPKVGLAASGGLHRLARQLPLKTAMEIALLGDLFSAGQALSYGLVNQVVEPAQLKETVNALLDKLRECAPLALRATKQMMLQGLDAGGIAPAFAQTYDEFERMYGSEDALEGMAAFTAKRKPRWRGR